MEAELQSSRIDWDRRFRACVAEVIARATTRESSDSFCTTNAFIIVCMLRGVAMQSMLDPAGLPLDQAMLRVTVAIHSLMSHE